MSKSILKVLTMYGTANDIEEFDRMLDVIEWALGADRALPEGMQHPVLQRALRDTMEGKPCNPLACTKCGTPVDDRGEQCACEEDKP